MSWQWIPIFGLKCTLHLNTCKRDCHQKQWEKIGLTAFNMNANHEHQHNTRKHTKKHYARSLGKKSMEEKIQNRKTARKPQKKKRTIPWQKGCLGNSLQTICFWLVFSRVLLVDQDTSTGILCAKNILKSRTVPDTEKKSPQHRNYTRV